MTSNQVGVGMGIGADASSRIVVTKLLDGGAAAEFGLCIGDIVMQVDGYSVTTISG